MTRTSSSGMQPDARPAEPSMLPHGGAAGFRTDLIFLWGAVLVALALRLSPWRLMFADGSFVFHQPDGYYHLRRVGIILQSFPRIPAIDMYMAYPFGAECPWPPLYDLGIALLSYLAGMGKPSPEIVRGVATLLPPVLASLTILPVHGIARMLAGPAAARIAAALAVAVPHHVILSTVGSGDHHAAVTLLVGCALYCFVRSLSGDDARLRRRSAGASGAFLGASVLAWQGAIAFGAVLAAGAGLSWLAARPAVGAAGSASADDRALRSALWALSVAAAIAALGRLAWPSATEQTVFGFGFFSWFQPAFLLVLLASLAVPFVAGRPAAGGARTRRIRAARAAASLAIPAAALLAVPAFRNNLVSAGGFLLGRDPWLRSISEFRPSLVPEMFSEPYSAVLFGLFAASLLLPAAVAAVAWAKSRRTGVPPGVALFAAWTLVIGAMAFLQRRWAADYAMNVAIGAGWAVALARAGGQRAPAGGIRRPGAPWRFVLAPLAVLLVAVPQVLFVRDLLANPRVMLVPLYDASLAWLRDSTPSPGDPRRPDVKPDYSVLADWGYGHAIQYVALRPTVVNNFGAQLRGNGLEDMLRFYAAPDEASMADLCTRRGVRYLYLTNVYPPLQLFSMLPDAGGRADLARGPRGSVAYSGLFLEDGQAAPARPAMTRFRLIYESGSDEEGPYFDPFGRVKIYEFVKGADIRGAAGPDEEVEIACLLATGAGRVFEYRNVVRADRNGVFSVRFPYATAGGRSAVRASGPAIARIGGRSIRFDVSDADVVGGGAVAVGAARAR